MSKTKNQHQNHQKPTLKQSKTPMTTKTSSKVNKGFKTAPKELKTPKIVNESDLSPEVLALHQKWMSEVDEEVNALWTEFNQIRGELEQVYQTVNDYNFKENGWVDPQLKSILTKVSNQNPNFLYTWDELENLNHKIDAFYMGKIFNAKYMKQFNPLLMINAFDYGNKAYNKQLYDENEIENSSDGTTGGGNKIKVGAPQMKATVSKFKKLQGMANKLNIGVNMQFNFVLAPREINQFYDFKKEKNMKYGILQVKAKQQAQKQAKSYSQTQDQNIDMVMGRKKGLNR